MSACQKCWHDAAADDRAAKYEELVRERNGTGVCTPEEQAGPSAGRCIFCNRFTLHELTGEPMCGCGV